MSSIWMGKNEGAMKEIIKSLEENVAGVRNLSRMPSLLSDKHTVL
jgi:hypothetical protein